MRIIPRELNLLHKKPEKLSVLVSFKDLSEFLDISAFLQSLWLMRCWLGTMNIRFVVNRTQCCPISFVHFFCLCFQTQRHKFHLPSAIIGKSQIPFHNPSETLLNMKAAKNSLQVLSFTYLHNHPYLFMCLFNSVHWNQCITVPILSLELLLKISLARLMW